MQVTYKYIRKMAFVGRSTTFFWKPRFYKKKQTCASTPRDLQTPMLRAHSVRESIQLQLAKPLTAASIPVGDDEILTQDSPSPQDEAGGGRRGPERWGGGVTRGSARRRRRGRRESAEQMGEKERKKEVMLEGKVFCLFFFFFFFFFFNRNKWNSCSGGLWGWKEGGGWCLIWQVLTDFFVLKWNIIK